jgi:tetratricopeptide (TPR) repeat protein
VARRQIEQAIASFDRAVGHPEVAAEALVRRAFLLHRLGRHADALTALGTSPDTADPTVRYWHLMMKGRVSEALDRPDEAAASYQAARLLAPASQAPCVALASLFQRQGRVSDARKWAAEAWAAGRGAVSDPWWLYWPGELRFLGRWLEQMKAAS